MTDSDHRAFKNGRLIYYGQQPDAAYWDQSWDNQDTQAIYAAALNGELGYYEEIFPRHLPTGGLILEAGCGQAMLLIALQKRGYDIEGVDYAADTVSRVKAQFPDLRIRVGDVTDLKVRDDYYHGYISIGVAEHDEEGPQKILQEAHRILHPEGVACISVPHLNPLRVLKARLGFYSADSGILPFYQYVFSRADFTEQLAEAGFKVIATYQYGGYKGVKGELPFLEKMFEWPQGWRLRKWLMNSKWANRVNGHMMMYVARKA